jgi:hypothetical protein
LADIKEMSRRQPEGITLMKPLLMLTLGLLLVIGDGSAQVQNAGVFAGTWLRDPVAQRNGKTLPQVTWQVSFDDKAMTLTERSEAGATMRSVQYNLDGTESKDAKKDFTHRFKWDSAKQTIVLVETLPANDIRLGMVVTETWQLAEAGKALRVLRKFEPTDKNSPIHLGDQNYSFRRTEQN